MNKIENAYHTLNGKREASYALLLCIACIVFPIPIFAKDNAKNILLNCYHALLKSSSLQYDIKYKAKTFDGDDTMYFNCHVFMLRHQQDSLLGAYVRYSVNDSAYKIYDLKNIYEVNKNSRKAIKYDPQHGETGAITGTFDGQVILDYFLHPDHLKIVIDSANLVRLVQLNDTIINNISCYEVQTHFPDFEDFTDDYTNYYIRKSDYEIIKIIDICKFQNYQTQYKEMDISKYINAKISKNIFSSKTIPKTYSISIFKNPNDSKHALPCGSSAPVIYGRRYYDTDSLVNDTIIFENKVTLLDFWYMSCDPCIKAIPEIEKLKEKYAQNEFMAYGVNNLDTKATEIKKIKEFIKHNPIRYPILLGENEITDIYNIKAYPTFYIVDKTGKIAYHYIGYGDELYHDLDSVISQLIK